MSKIEEYIKSCAASAFPGAVWAVGNKGGILEKGCAGVLGEGLPPVTEDSLYDLASITKIFVSLAFMKQFEEGLLRLSDRVDYFLPSFKNCALGEATLFMLLTHTAPFPGGTRLYLHAKTRNDLLEAIRLSGVRADSPARVVYTCEAFILLGEIISAIDGAPLDEVIRRRVTTPLGLKDTCYRPASGLIQRIAPTENCVWRGKLVRGQVHDENAVVMGEVSGNAGIFSGADDMSLLGAAMLNSLDSNSRGGGGFLSRPCAEIMTRNHTAGKGENRGLGWMIAGQGASSGDLMSAGSFGHTGFTGTSIWIDPERNIFAVLLSNRVHPHRNNENLFRARHIFHNLAVMEYGK